VSSTGTAGDDFSVLAAISGDGRFVAFWSLASTLVPGDTNGTTDVFVHDRQAGTTEQVSVDSRERQSSGGDQGGTFDTNFGRPAISPDGRFVAFTSDADNLVVGDGNFDTDIFVRDRQTQTTVRSSMRSDGTETGVELGSLNASLSADGQVVAFESEGALVAEDGGFPVDVLCTTSNPSRPS
jgi:WD40-like Beta Propeller Repeat